MAEPSSFNNESLAVEREASLAFDVRRQEQYRRESTGEEQFISRARASLDKSQDSQETYAQNQREAEQSEARLLNNVRAFERAWRNHRGDHVAKLDREIDAYAVSSARLNSLSEEREEHRQEIIQIANNIYKNDAATPELLDLAFTKSRSVYKAEYNTLSFTKKMLMDTSERPTRRAISAALAQTRDTQNAYMMGKVILKNRRVLQKYSDDLSGMLLENEVIRNQKTDPNYRQNTKGQFVPREGTELYNRIVKCDYNPGQTIEARIAERDYWKSERIRINDAANTQSAIDRRARIARAEDSVNPLPNINEVTEVLDRSPSTLPGYRSRPPSYGSAADAGASFARQQVSGSRSWWDSHLTENAHLEETHSSGETMDVGTSRSRGYALRR
jgi:hypothetical protein